MRAVNRLLGGCSLHVGTLRRDFDGVTAFECLIISFRQLGNARTVFVVRVMSRCRELGLELVTELGQFREILVVGEWLAQALPIIAEL
jgi:hypothetical protein